MKSDQETEKRREKTGASVRSQPLPFIPPPFLHQNETSRASGVQCLHTHCVVTASSVPQDGLGDKRHVTGLLADTEKRCVGSRRWRHFK